jgi:potassium uptake TrkH family protein
MRRIEKKNSFISVPLIAGIAALISLLAQYGFYLNPKTLEFFRYLDRIIALIFVLSYFVKIIQSPNKWQAIKSSLLEGVLLFVFGLSLIFEGILMLRAISSELALTYIKLYYIIIQAYVLSNMLIALAKSRDNWLFVSLNPSRVFVASFISVILVGVVLLKLPRATYNGIEWIDALFISTSAVCVTGLTPLNIVDTFTPIGQGVILFLFQIGGLGIVTLTSFLALLFQSSGGFRLRDQVILMEILDDTNLSKLGEILKAIVRLTLVFELIGAVILWARWGNFGLAPGQRVFTAVFHSVSAYCNAGFSNLQNGLETVHFSSDPITLITIMLLIIIGGLGFYTIREILFNKQVRPDKHFHLSLQTRMILGISGGLIVVGALAITLIQWNGWGDMPNWLKILNGFFTSVTSRTAGFSTVPVSGLNLPAILMIIFLMYIGAAPNSTGGGIKVTTLSALVAASWAFIRGKDRVEIDWNTIPMTTIRRSYIVLISSLGLIVLAVFLISLVEQMDFVDMLFEVVSAFGTVGLSRGITPLLSVFSKTVITIIMFMGRVGLYTLAIAVGRESLSRHDYSFPETNMMVG